MNLMTNLAGATLLRDCGVQMVQVLQAIAEGGGAVSGLTGKKPLVVAGKTKIVDFRGIWGVYGLGVRPGQQFQEF